MSRRRRRRRLSGGASGWALAARQMSCASQPPAAQPAGPQRQSVGPIGRVAAHQFGCARTRAPKRPNKPAGGALGQELCALNYERAPCTRVVKVSWRPAGRKCAPLLLIAQRRSVGCATGRPADSARATKRASERSLSRPAGQSEGSPRRCALAAERAREPHGGRRALGRDIWPA